MPHAHLTLAGLALALGATLRIVRFVTADVLAAPIRAWVLKTWGLDSLPHTLINCSWCSSVWVAAGVFGLWALAGDTYWLALPAAALSVSYLTGLAAEWIED